MGSDASRGFQTEPGRQMYFGVTEAKTGHGADGFEGLAKRVLTRSTHLRNLQW